MRRWVVVVFVVVLASGCGRSEGEEFREDSLRPLQQQLERERARVAATLRVVRPGSERGARAVRADVGAMSRTAEKIDALGPPTEVEEDFDAYTEALQDLVKKLLLFPSAVRSGSAAGLGTVSRRVQDATGLVEQRGHSLEEALADV